VNDDQPAPAAPGNLTATAVSTSQINLSWTDNADNESGYYVERGADTNWTRIATVDANVRTYSNTGLAANTTYGYRVQAYNASGVSGYSNTASATTASAPTIHVGDLDGTRSVAKKSWSASVTIAVHNTGHGLVSGAQVTGAWSGGASGTASCTTSRKGVCTVNKSGILLTTGSVTFTVNGVTLAGYSYDPVQNHDVDSGTDGTTITVTK
jgi:hypothetical protein